MSAAMSAQSTAETEKNAIISEIEENLTNSASNNLHKNKVSDCLCSLSLPSFEVLTQFNHLTI